MPSTCFCCMYCSLSTFWPFALFLSHTVGWVKYSTRHSFSYSLVYWYKTVCLSMTCTTVSVPLSTPKNVLSLVSCRYANTYRKNSPFGSCLLCDKRIRLSPRLWCCSFFIIIIIGGVGAWCVVSGRLFTGISTFEQVKVFAFNWILTMLLFGLYINKHETNNTVLKLRNI